MEDVVISSLHHKNLVLCCGLVPRRNRPWWNPRRLERSPNECWLAWDQETKRKKAQRKVGFFLVFSFFRHQKKRDGLPPKSVESESNMLPCGYRGAQNLQDGMDNSILSSPKPKVYAVKKTKRQKGGGAKKCWIPRTRPPRA